MGLVPMSPKTTPSARGPPVTWLRDAGLVDMGLTLQLGGAALAVGSLLLDGIAAITGGAWFIHCLRKL
jgi:hypothetical protein